MSALPPYGKLPAGFSLGNRFQIMEQIGAGASSFVYRAGDLQNSSEVVVKLLNPFLKRDRVSVERFRRELLICRAIDHPQIVKVFDFCEQDSFCYLVMEYVEGINLKRLIDQQGPLPVEQFLLYAQQIATVLDRCHQAGVIHRDLKPSNLIRTTTGLIRLMDFGVAKLNTMSDLTKTGTMIGTPQYMAPELFLKERPDPRSDIYSLGVVFFELLTGHPPYPSYAIPVFTDPTGKRPPPSVREKNPAVPLWLEEIITTMLQTNPNRRYRGMEEVCYNLSRGEQALQTSMGNQAAGLCLFCQQDLLAGLPFCGHCGTSFLEAARRGRHSLVLYESRHPEGVANHLAKRLPSLSPQRLIRTLSKTPVVIVKRVNEKTAALLFSDLNLFPVRLELVQSLPRQMDMPTHFVVTSLLCSVLLSLFMGSISIGFSSFWKVVAAESLLLGGIGFYFIRLTAPLIPLSTIRQGEHTDPLWSLEKIVSYQRRIRAINDEDYKGIIASLLARAFQISRWLPKENQASELGRLQESVEVAFGLVSRMEEMERYLAATTLNALYEKEQILGTQSDQEQDMEKLTRLMEQKSRFVEAQRAYSQIEDQFTRCYHQLLNLSSRIHLLAARLSEKEEEAGGGVTGLWEATQTIQLEEIAPQIKAALEASV